MKIIIIKSTRLLGDCPIFINNILHPPGYLSRAQLLSNGPANHQLIGLRQENCEHELSMLLGCKRVILTIQASVSDMSTVIHRLMIHHHSMIHPYNITHEHPLLKIIRQKHSNKLNEPPHKISSKTDYFWMHYSQI